MLMMRIALARQKCVADLEASFGHKVKLLFRLSAQGLVRSLKLKFRRDFEAEEFGRYFAADVWLRLRS